MLYAFKNRNLSSIYIISAVFLWIALFPAHVWGAQVPGGGNAVDGTIRDVTADQVSKGLGITNAPSISEISDSSKPGQIVSSPSGSSESLSSGSPVLVCGSGKAAPAPGQNKNKLVKKGTSLGMFVTTGYCSCEECSAGFGLTYSGTVPQAQHTISADITRFPVGTRLMIHDVIYTVEDTGSNVTGDHIDIYYDNHEDAVAHGKQTEEVFTIE